MSDSSQITKDTIQPRPMGSFNRVGLITIIQREVGRFMSVYMQTIVAPVVTSLLFFSVLALAFGSDRPDIGGVPYLEFLAPGLVMMTMVQNAFANSSSSMVIAKVQGNIVDILLPPVGAFEIYSGYIIGALLRGLSVGVAAGVVMSFIVPMGVHSFGAILLFAVLGNMLLGSMGLAGGIWSEKFDHIAAVTNFVVTPLTFLSGTFYSIERLPHIFNELAHYNPFFHMIDGFRYGFIGYADGSLLMGVVILIISNLLMTGLCLWMLKTGYKIKS